MVKQCFLCKKSCGMDPNLTFYMFPFNESFRQKWFQSIGREYDERKYLYLCSDHFAPEDFVVKSTVKPYLKNDALPKPLGTEYRHDQFLGMHPENFYIQTPSEDLIKTEIINDTSDSVPDETPASWRIESIDDYYTPTDNDENIHESGHMKDEISSIPEDVSVVIESSESNFDDLALPPLKNEGIERDDDLYHSTQKPKRFIQPRYFGDCDPSYLSHPSVAKKNWEVAKLTIEKQKKKITSLQTAVRRLKTKTNTLNLLFKYLRDNDLVTEIGHSVMAAFLKK